MIVTATFLIEVEFGGGLTNSQRSVFSAAAERWQQIIIGDLPDVEVGDRVIDDVLILASGKAIDGAGSILGQAGPTHIRSDTSLPARGIMQFDIADLNLMETEGTLLSVIIHEMGHVLGIGTLWQELGLLQGAGTDDPVFVGQNAMQEYAALIGADEATPVPVANTGGEGTRDGHWRELVFGNELMTGFVRGEANPISRLTIASLRDLGYETDIEAADVFALPSRDELFAMLMREAAHEHRRCTMICPKFEKLGEDAAIK